MKLSKSYPTIILLGTMLPVQAQVLDFARGGIGGQSTSASDRAVGYDIAVGGSKQSYIIGDFDAAVDFDPGPGEFILDSGTDDLFLAKYDTDGSFVWAFAIGGNNYAHGAALAVDDAENIYVIGSFSGSVDFDPGPGEFLLDGGGAVVAKYDQEGNLRWAFPFNNITGFNGSLRAISLDAWGNLLITGSFVGTVDFDPGPGQFNLTSIGSDDAFVAKYDLDGNLSWAIRIGGAASDYAEGITVEQSGSFYITGLFASETVDFDPGPDEFYVTGSGLFVARYSPRGGLLWAFGTDNEFCFAGGKSVAVDDLGNAYVTGEFCEDTDFKPGPEQYVLPNEELYWYDVFVAKYGPSGILIWAFKIQSDLFARSETAEDIAVDADRNAYVTGTLCKMMDFDPGPDMYTLIETPLNLSCEEYGILGGDAFLAKYDTEGHFMWAFDIGKTGTNEGDIGYGVDLDANGHAYLTGAFDGTTDFDPGPGSLDLVSNSKWSTFVAKYGDPDPIYRVNAGGPRIPDSPIDWEPDSRSNPSPFLNADGPATRTGHTKEIIANPTPAADPVFSTYRWDPAESPERDMQWSFPVESGTYKVCFLFSETNKNIGAGDRVFDVNIEGETIHDGLDVMATVGAFTGMRRCAFSTIADERIDIDFISGSGRPFLSGIEISPATPGAMQLAEGAHLESVEHQYTLGIDAQTTLLPKKFAIETAYPNPFNPSTTIRFFLPEQAQVRLSVYDMLGREVTRLMEGIREAGSHEVTFDAGDLPSGTYLYRLETPDGALTQKMLLLK